jgi:hypothetical protein
MRFLISCGETRTLLRCKDSDMAVVPVVLTGKKEPLLTTIEEGAGKQSEVEESVLASDVMWEVAPESKYQSTF